MAGEGQRKKTRVAQPGGDSQATAPKRQVMTEIVVNGKKIKKAVLSKYAADRLLDVLPKSHQVMLRNALGPIIFQKCKMIVSRDHVELSKGLVDTVFAAMGIDKNTPEDTFRRCYVWNAATDFVYRTVNGMKNKKIYRFGNMIKGMCYGVLGYVFVDC